MSGIASLFDQLGVWTWWVIAALLAIVELIVPGVFFIWLAAAAAAVGLIVLVVPLGWEWQVFFFALFSVAAVILSRFYMRKAEPPRDNPLLNQRAATYIGRQFRLETPISDGRGKVRVGDTLWSAEGPDLPAGSKVEVVAVKSSVLIVKEAGSAQSA